MDKIAADFTGKARIDKINVREDGTTPRKYGVSLIPTTVILKDGMQVEKFVGFRREQILTESLKKHISQ